VQNSASMLILATYHTICGAFTENLSAYASIA